MAAMGRPAILEGDMLVSPTNPVDPFTGPQQERGQAMNTQVRALIVKSFLVQKRQWKTNVCQLLFPLMMMGMMYGLQLYVNHLIFATYGGSFPAIVHPTTSPPYLVFYRADAANCSAGTGLPVTDDKIGQFIVTDNGMGQLDSTRGLLASFQLPDQGAAIKGIFALGALKRYSSGGTPASLCLSQPKLVTKLNFAIFPSDAAVDVELYSSWRTHNYIGGVSVSAASATQYNYNILVNDTFTDNSDLSSLTGLVTNAVYRDMITRGGASASPLSQVVMIGAKSFPAPEIPITFDLVSLVGPSVYVYIFSLLLPVFMSNIVSEKETKIRDLMAMMGLRSNVHFAVTYCFNYGLFIFSMAFLICIAVILDFRAFTQNAFLTYFVLIVIWGHVLCALAFLLAMPFTSSKTATVVGYLIVFGLGMIASTLMRNFFASSSTTPSTMFFIQLVPTFALFRALWELRQAVAFNSPGLSVADLADNDVHLTTVYTYLICEWLFFLTIAIYLNMVKTPFGPRKRIFSHIKDFLNRARSMSNIGVTDNAVVVVDGSDQDEGADVAAQRVLANDVNIPAAVRIQGLRKVYRGRNGIKDKVAVCGLSMIVKSGECRGFLGSNGAGKSTTISMLCGYTSPTSGRALMFGRDVVDDIDMIHTVMGVCPQENVLWGELTGGEHLDFFGSLKGLQGEALESAIVIGLSEVELLSVRDKQVMQYSGGMKRRLCVAIAFIGNPVVVLLDEPSTGLDPAARRGLWSVILRRKKGCAMLLTTHSMEEAEHLCDTVGIFEQGRLRCIGTSSQLKHRFEKGFKLTLTTDCKHEEAEISTFIRSIVPTAALLNSICGVINYELPCAATNLAVVFDIMERNRARLGVDDWCIANTTLEEVFVRIATGLYDNLAKPNEVADVVAGDRSATRNTKSNAKGE